MSKYTKQFKLGVVKRYLEGSGGYKTVAHQFEIDPSFVRKWVQQFEAHREGGLDKKFSYYPAEFKLSVLQHMWNKQLSCRETAISFDIRNLSMVREWERSYHSGGIEALPPPVLEEDLQPCQHPKNPDHNQQEPTTTAAAKNCWKK